MDLTFSVNRKVYGRCRKIRLDPGHLMKLFGFLNRDRAAPVAPPVVPPVNVPQEQSPEAAEQAPGVTGKDSLTIEQESAAGGNPYETQSWEADPEKGLRRVEDSKTARRDRVSAEVSDPYNTGGFRKGW
jgi:hypothetical protein